MTKQHRRQGKNRKIAAIAARARQRNKQERLGIPVAADPATRFAVAKHKRSKND